MPLIKSRSKKAFSKNVAKEMDAGKPQPQALAIAYDVKRKAPKKMAEGGMNSRPDKGWGAIIVKPGGGGIKQSTEMAEGGEIMKPKMMQRKHPKMVESKVMKVKNLDSSGMPMDEDDKDQEMLHKNEGKKPLKDSDWTGRPTVRQAQEDSPASEKRPKIQGENDFDGNELITADKPDGYGKQPKKAMDEMEADKSGPKVPDMAREHSNGRKPYAKGGKINDYVSMNSAEQDNLEEPAGLQEDDDQERMPVDEYMDNNHMAPMLAEGGMLDDEMEDEHHSSVAAAIMAKRAKMHAMIDSGAMDEDDAVKGYADGGEVDLNLNSMEQPNSYYKRNEDAALKENYDSDFKDLSQPEDSNEHGDDIDSDRHDMVSAIRRKMAKRKQF